MQLNPYNQDGIDVAPASLQPDSVATSMLNEGTLLIDRTTDSHVTFKAIHSAYQPWNDGQHNPPT